jgi:hypothetical protein
VIQVFNTLDMAFKIIVTYVLKKKSNKMEIFSRKLETVKKESSGKELIYSIRN